MRRRRRRKKMLLLPEEPLMAVWNLPCLLEPEWTSLWLTYGVLKLIPAKLLVQLDPSSI